LDPGLSVVGIPTHPGTATNGTGVNGHSANGNGRSNGHGYISDDVLRTPAREVREEEA
jgi:hypothetical protein